MIDNLFSTDKIVLYGRIDRISEEEELHVIERLESQYNKESVDYPAPVPSFHRESAIWSAKILFNAGQLVMYREHDAEFLSSYFEKFSEQKTASAIVSADLCLRYIPSIIKYLEQIDVEDELIPLLKDLLKEWHYSGLLSDIPLKIDDTQGVINDPCLSKLYIDRIIENKRNDIGQNENFRSLILSAMGDHRNIFWKDFK